MTWNKTTKRILGWTLYNRDYAYADPKRSMKHMFFDLVPDEDLETPLFTHATEDGDDEREDPDFSGAEKPDSKLFSYLCGNINQKTGELCFTQLGPKLYTSLMARLEEERMLVPFVLAPHEGDVIAAKKIADKKGHDRFAIQRKLRGAFRGIYHGASLGTDGLYMTVFICLLIDNEPLWRMRELCAYYARQPGEADAALQTRVAKTAPDKMSSRDGFAAFGTNSGAAFHFDSAAKGETLYQFGEYAFVRKGRRVSAMTVTSAEDPSISTRLDLALEPKTINAAFALMRHWR